MAISMSSVRLTAGSFTPPDGEGITSLLKVDAYDSSALRAATKI
jgi:hypothetical protein